jgi:hypothetical protein
MKPYAYSQRKSSNLHREEKEQAEETDRQKEKDRGSKAECIQSKACSEAAIQSVATSTQKETNEIGLHCCRRWRR